MARVFLSFLGIGRYLPCKYFYNNKTSPVVRFVQEATTAFFCSDWQPEDRIAIFTTPDACQRNWLDHPEESQGFQDGLGTRLEKLSLPPQVLRVDIPEGKNEEEIWQIFQIVFQQLQQQDKVVFDITHAFRSIPMLAMVVLPYAKVLQDIAIEGIYYGAFETLGTLQEADKIPVPQRQVPIFNLTPFADILNWSLAIDRFIGSGDAGPVRQLAHEKAASRLAVVKGKDQAAQAIKNLSEHLYTFSLVMATCRCQEITRITGQLQDDLQKCLAVGFLPALKPLLARLADRLQVFNSDDVHNGFRAAQWCLEHNLIQQGFTILRETVISFFAQEAGVDLSNRTLRELVTKAAVIRRNNISLQDWQEDARQHPDIIQKYSQVLQYHPEMGKILLDIIEPRNDINHCGCVANPKKAKNFKQVLTRLLEQLNQGPKDSGQEKEIPDAT